MDGKTPEFLRADAPTFVDFTCLDHFDHGDSWFERHNDSIGGIPRTPCVLNANDENSPPWPSHSTSTKSKASAGSRSTRAKRTTLKPQNPVDSAEKSASVIAADSCPHRRYNLRSSPVLQQLSEVNITFSLSGSLHKNGQAPQPSRASDAEISVKGKYVEPTLPRDQDDSDGAATKARSPAEAGQQMDVVAKRVRSIRLRARAFAKSRAAASVEVHHEPVHTGGAGVVTDLRVKAKAFAKSRAAACADVSGPLRTETERSKSKVLKNARSTSAPAAGRRAIQASSSTRVSTESVEEGTTSSSMTTATTTTAGEPAAPAAVRNQQMPLRKVRIQPKPTRALKLRMTRIGQPSSNRKNERPKLRVKRRSARVRTVPNARKSVTVPKPFRLETAERGNRFHDCFNARVEKEAEEQRQAERNQRRFRATSAIVLKKRQWVPQKTETKPIRQVPFNLRLESRAAERKTFDTKIQRRIAEREASSSRLAREEDERAVKAIRMRAEFKATKLKRLRSRSRGTPYNLRARNRGANNNRNGPRQR